MEWGKKVIEKALEYANYEWTAKEKNIKHGTDSNGVEVEAESKKCRDGIRMGISFYHRGVLKSNFRREICRKCTGR